EDVVHSWAHEHLAERRQRPRAPGEAERVRGRDCQRTDAEPAPAVRGQAVRGFGRLAGRERWQDEAGGAMTVVEDVGDGEKRRRAVGVVREREVDATVAPHVQTRRSDRPVRDELVTTRPGPYHARDEEQRDAGREDP